MEDIEAVLWQPAVVLAPEVKVFVVRFLACYQRGPVVRRVKDMAKELGVTDRAVTHAVRSLEVMGFLSRTPQLQGRRRPSFAYALTPQLFPDVPDKDAASGHASMVGLIAKVAIAGRSAEWLVSCSKEKVAQGAIPGGPSKADPTVAKEGRLNSAGQLLLMTLLVRADVTGAVRGVGYAVLAKQTGVAKRRIHALVAELRNGEYIRAFVPGAPPGPIFHCTPGAYFLNLQHPIYAGVGRLTQIMAYSEKWPSLPVTSLAADRPDPASPTEYEPREAHELLAILRRLQKKESTPHQRPDGAASSPLLKDELLPVKVRTGYPWAQVSVPNTEVLLSVAPWFTKRGEAFADFLQARLESYAEDWLNQDWNALVMGINEPLRARIEQEMLGRHGGIEPADETRDKQQLAVDLILDLSRGIAEAVQRLLKISNQVKLPPSSLRHCLLPHQGRNDRERFVVVSTAKRSLKTEAECWVIIVEKSQTFSKTVAVRQVGHYSQLGKK